MLLDDPRATDLRAEGKRLGSPTECPNCGQGYWSLTPHGRECGADGLTLTALFVESYEPFDVDAAWRDSREMQIEKMRQAQAEEDADEL